MIAFEQASWEGTSKVAVACLVQKNATILAHFKAVKSPKGVYSIQAAIIIGPALQ